METILRRKGRPPKVKPEDIDSLESVIVTEAASPVMQTQASRFVAVAPTPAAVVPPTVVEPLVSYGYAMKVQMAIGVDLLGASMSLVSKHGKTLEITSLGIRAKGQSKGKQRIVLIPWANIRGIELYP